MTIKRDTARLVRTLRGGQITIPADFRKELGIEDDTLLQLTLEAGELRLRPVEVRQSKGSQQLRELYEHFTAVREEILAQGVGEEEINTDIDAAVRAVRKGHGR